MARVMMNMVVRVRKRFWCMLCFKGPQLVAQVRQYAQRNEGDHQRDNGPPGVIEWGFRVE